MLLIDAKEMDNMNYKIGCIACLAIVCMVVAFISYIGLLIWSIIIDTTI